MEPLGENLISLKKTLNGFRFSIDLAKRIARQTLLGLDYLHSCCGIIHTGIDLDLLCLTVDLHPNNILVVPPDVKASFSTATLPLRPAGVSQAAEEISTEDPSEPPTSLIPCLPLQSFQQGTDHALTVKISDLGMGNSPASKRI
jgi:serine/threonine-protein kinase SRPK3